MADDKADEWHTRVLGMADDLGLDGDERDEYIHDHMTAKGYKVVRTYVPGDDDGNDGRQQRRRFATGGGGRGGGGSGGRDQGRRRNRDDDDW